MSMDALLTALADPARWRLLNLLAEREDGHDPGPREGLEVLGGLGLAEAGQLRELTDRARPVGQEFDHAPSRRVSECGGDRVHESEYSHI